MEVEFTDQNGKVIGTGRTGIRGPTCSICGEDATHATVILVKRDHGHYTTSRPEAYEHRCDRHKDEVLTVDATTIMR